MPVGWLDACLGGVLVLYALLTTLQDPLATHPFSEVAAALMAGSVLLRTVAPLAMSMVASAGVLAVALLPGAATPLWTFLAILLVCFSVGANLDGRRRWVALGVLLASAYCIQLASVDRGDPSDNSFSEVFLAPPVIIGGPAFAGALLRRSRAQTRELRRLSSELTAERNRHTEEAVTAERNRIARELHDVVSHAVTVMVVQAGAAEQLLDVSHPAREHVHAVRGTGKQALAELRRQLGMMRDAGPSSASPLPGLPQIAGLVQASGARLAFDHGSLEQEVAPGIGLTAYRVVQEALTNAQRHAPGAPVTVHLARGHDDLVIRVVDDGSGVSAAHGAGIGLRGMRERIEMYGGCLDVGPREDHPGWRVTARIPVANPGEPA
jgi:signal transduction histidine kinase